MGKVYGPTGPRKSPALPPAPSSVQSRQGDQCTQIQQVWGRAGEPPLSPACWGCRPAGPPTAPGRALELPAQAGDYLQGRCSSPSKFLKSLCDAPRLPPADDPPPGTVVGSFCAVICYVPGTALRVGERG